MNNMEQSVISGGTHRTRLSITPLLRIGQRTRECSCKTLLIICILLNLIVLSTYQFPRISNVLNSHYYRKQHTNATEAGMDPTCAQSILHACAQNHILPSECSWTIGTFRNHFYSMAALISRPFPDSMNNNTGLAFIRLGDGEMKLMFGVAVQSIDPWAWHGGQSRLGQDLRKALRFAKYQYNEFSPFYYGIYDAKEICPFHELLTLIYQHPKYLTYTNLFVNSNYPATKLLHRALIRDHKKKIILIINNETTTKRLTELREWAGEIVQYPNDGPLMWENDGLREQAIARIVAAAKKYRNRLFAFSVGPLSRVLIHHAWLENPYNRYIDFGSTLDAMTKDRVTRPYQSNAELYHDPTYLVTFHEGQHRFHVSAVD